MSQSKILPVVALRDMAIMPEMMIHFDVSRKITINAIEKAMMGEQFIFVAAQKDPRVDKPEMKDLYDAGTICIVKQMVRLPGNVIRVMVMGVDRAKLLSLPVTDPYLEGVVVTEEDTEFAKLPENERKAMLLHLRELAQVYGSENQRFVTSTEKQIKDVNNLAKLIDIISSNIPLSMEEKIELLGEVSIAERYNKVAVILVQAIELLRYKKAFQQKVKEQVDKNQKDYILREQMKVIREELGETEEDESKVFYKKLEELEASKEVKEKIGKEIERYKNLSNNVSESAVLRGYIETLLALPWDKKSKDNKDLKKAEKILESQHYGMKKIKERILEFLAVRILTGEAESPIICLVGPPGTGKTSIAKSIAEAVGKEYVRVCLGGVRDEAEIRGHRKTYVGAMPGRFVYALKDAKVKNPLILLDEIDKVSSDYKGDTSAALLEVLDSEQNSKFIDHYVELPIDLSEVLFIATANSVETIPRPLLDRMELIEVSSYTQNEKLQIAKKYLVKKQLKKNGLKAKQLTISNKALELIISGYTREAGVRGLERKIGEICRKAARELLEEDALTGKVVEEKGSKEKASKEADSKAKKTDSKTTIKVTDKNLEHYLGKIKYTLEEVNKKDEVGIVRGLAWTSVGGDTLEIEVNIMPGKGEMEMTGQLGDVMKESVQIAMNYVRSIASKYNIDGEFFETHDFHIHIPDGATPKDGPSAGITMATAIFSAVTNQKVKAKIAMTGEVTLRGRVLPIGGLKEKLLAAKMAKVKMVLVPKENQKDVEEIEAEITEGLEIQFVETMEEVLSYALAE